MKERNHDHLLPDLSFDGGDLDCGNGLLLLIRRHIDPLDQGKLLEIRSTEPSVETDLPSWCRLTGNELVEILREAEGNVRRYLIRKGGPSSKPPKTIASAIPAPLEHLLRAVVIPERLPRPSPAPDIAPLSTMCIGSWPRPNWMLRAIHERLEGRTDPVTFAETGNDAVRLCVASQLEAGVDVVTDGEQRRDSYASFVGGILDNAQLIPLSDLSAMVDDPEKFREELAALDVPADDVRHPVPLGPLGRSEPLAVHEFEFAASLTDKPIKIALPGPYLLTRTMWLDCLRDNSYNSREDVAKDIVRILREELHYLLAAGVALVQFDEPVLTEVVFTRPDKSRSFMCGALSEKGAPEDELRFASDLINQVVAGLPKERTAVHICRGNWTKDEGALLAGNYQPLLPYLRSATVGTLFLEYSTPRAGEIELLSQIPETVRIGLGVVNPRSERVETVEEIVGRARAAMSLIGRDRLLLNSDCGFATFADNPVASASIAKSKLVSMAAATHLLRGEQ
ncbi:MAG: sulfurtransferase TusA family protein [Planctomycetota bacterium]